MVAFSRQTVPVATLIAFVFDVSSPCKVIQAVIYWVVIQVTNQQTRPIT
jgi:hypothetical protein